MRLPSRLASVLLAAALGLMPAIAAAEPVIGVAPPPPPPGGWQRPPPGGGPGYHRPPPPNRGYYRSGPRWHRDYDDDGAGAAAAAGIIGLAVGAMVAGQAARGDGHVARCLNRYRSYDPDTDTYRGYDGRLHRCRL